MYEIRFKMTFFLVKHKGYFLDISYISCHHVHLKYAYFVEYLKSLFCFVLAMICSSINMAFYFYLFMDATYLYIFIILWFNLEIPYAYLFIALILTWYDMLQVRFGNVIQRKGLWFLFHILCCSNYLCLLFVDNICTRQSFWTFVKQRPHFPGIEIIAELFCSRLQCLMIHLNFWHWRWLNFLRFWKHNIRNMEGEELLFRSNSNVPNFYCPYYFLILNWRLPE